MLIQYGISRGTSYYAPPGDTIDYNSVNPSINLNYSATSFYCTIPGLKSGTGSSVYVVLSFEVLVNGGGWVTLQTRGITMPSSTSSHNFSANIPSYDGSMIAKQGIIDARLYVNSGGVYSGSASFTLTFDASLDYTACTPPTYITVDKPTPVIGDTVTVSWSGAGAGVGNPITGYQMYRATSPSGTYSAYGSRILTSSTSGSRSNTAVPTTIGSSYYYNVRTYGTLDGLYSVPSASVQVTATPGLCVAPTTFTVDNPTPPPGTTVTLSWSGAAGGTGNAITGYQVYRSLTANGTYAAYGNKIVTGETFGSLSEVAIPIGIGSSYFFKIKTIGSYTGYDSPFSDYVSVRATADSCVAPTTFTVDNPTPPPGTTVTLSWSGAAGGTGNAITGYQVYRSLTANGTYAAYGNKIVTGETFGSLSNVEIPSEIGDSYFFKVKTIGTIADFDSDFSDDVQITTEELPCTPPTTIGVSTPYGEPFSYVALYWSGGASGGTYAITGYRVFSDTQEDGDFETVVGETATDASSGNYLVVVPEEGTLYYRVMTLGDTTAHNSIKSSAVAQITSAERPVIEGYVGSTNAQGWW